MTTVRGRETGALSRRPLAWACLAQALLLALSVRSPAAELKFTYVDLIGRLTDLERLAVLPESGEGCAQCSSYDRGSKYDERAGKYVNWAANGDGGGFIRKEGEEFVLAEMEGPGCIWRIWSAAPGGGHVKIFLDGAAEPAVDLPFKGYFDRKNEPFTRAALVHNAASGQNCYMPIPYQKSCKVVAQKGWGNYYHFTYGTFPKGTVVPMFKRELSPEENAALDSADKVLSGCGSDPSAKDVLTVKREATVEPGAMAAVAEIAGPRAITAIRVKMNTPPSPADRSVLRELVLRITWDGEKAPAVWSPLGDFFGTSGGANLYRSFPLGMTKDGWYCFWYMPFATGALVELVNEGKDRRNVTFEITHAPLSRPAEKLGRFHAKWHRDFLLPDDPDRKIDWTMLKTEGIGRFCGVMLSVWNPRGGWWGEGDEKFFIDGEKFPSTFGTGSEDYFGYAWCNPTLFQNCYHNQTISQGNKGHVSVNRWHIADNVPFQKSFEGCIEKYFDQRTVYACICYWYLAPGGKDPYPAVPLDERVKYWEPPVYPHVKDAVEGEELKIISTSGGKTQARDMGESSSKWSGGSQLWWTGAKQGDSLELAVPVAAAGKYKVLVRFAKSKEGGIVELSLDGNKLGEPVDLYDPQTVPSGELDMGTMELSVGEHKLAIVLKGASPKAGKSRVVGLDYVRLVAGAAAGDSTTSRPGTAP